MGTRRHSRELALQILYQIEMTGDDPESVIAQFWDAHPADLSVRDYAGLLVRGTRTMIEQIDPLLTAYAANWELARMAVVDRNLLRLAVYEMLHGGGTPPIVVINEAVDIAKKYSTPESGAFVNGILDRVRKEEIRDAT